ncbi:hypothetical protein BACCIP111895_04545 [Neobacillus rhizosphaerae]|uniref:DUF4179 domain-containing protein n=1 Tax=Neobacillus rhizosphaerae TaxID=2880965 RepID=A0ABM9EXG2_9BACI|nr:DUF4179 domain-containing protein [Neobacillus rhizosphaerae]CAH2717353.1 hypothetical protein BACCIP111895_04545 [Neobacillus rhizosphaerae]
MEKKSFQEAFEMINVPKEDVINAIRSGMDRAHLNERKKSIKKILWSTAAATILVSSSFISPSLSKVMAEVPLLGNVYTTFNDAIGRSLESKSLITELNKSASFNGIDVSITNAYYDGGVVGVTFNVKGNMKVEKNGKLVGFYQIFDGKDDISDSKELVYMEPSENGYVGHIQLSYPQTQLPSNTTFPLEFKKIGEQEGSWKFDVPIKQLPYVIKKVDKESIQDIAGVKVHFDSVIKGKASTAINYTATFPVEGRNDQVRLEIYDDKGKKINISKDGIDLETFKQNDKIVVKGRSIIPESLDGKTSYIEVHPKVALSERSQFVELNEPIPVNIKANRQDLFVQIDKISVNNNKNLIVDFQVNKGVKKDWNFGFFKDFARNDVILVKKTEKDIYKEPINHSLETVNKDGLRFRSTFDISKLNDFSLNNYVIRVNMGSLSSNIPVELDDVRIDLNELSN